MRTVVMAAIVLACAGCLEKGPAAPTMDSEARTQIEQLKRDVALLKLENALNRMDATGLGSDHAVFDPQSAPAFTKLKAPTGAVLASLERVEPYLGGFNVYVKIGNPSTADLIGMSGEVKWGKADASGDALKSKRFELLDTYPAGTWKLAKLTIGPATAVDVQKIVFQPTFNQISLVTRN